MKTIDLSWAKYHNWKKRFGQPNNHNGKIPRDFWLEDWEIQAIIDFKHDHMAEGYKRLTYMMMYQDIVAVSPSTSYRVLRNAGLTSRWNNKKLSSKGNGFVQPLKSHEHWHMDISYINFRGSHLFLISVLDGYSRFVVHHQVRTHMQEYDVELVLQQALEKYPNEKPRIITDNGSQFIANDFKAFLRQVNLIHVRTSVNYPQSNGKIEAFHKNIKSECIRQTSFLNPQEVHDKVADYIHHYNNIRLHSGINYITPYDMLCGKSNTIFKERDRKLEMARKKRRLNNQMKKVSKTNSESFFDRIPSQKSRRGKDEKTQKLAYFN